MRGTKFIIGATVALGLVFTSAVTPALADTWRYPGGANCTKQIAYTWSRTKDGSGTQHRAEGYGGYYYASWPSTWYYEMRLKEWGWYTILSSRIGTTGSGGTVTDVQVGCLT